MPSPLTPHPSPALIAAYRADQEAPPELCCPISQAPLLRPVRVGVGGRHIYSEDAIMQWARHQVAQGQVPTDPLTRRPLPGTTLVREPAATAALNRLRRGAADLHDKEGNAAAAADLRKLADDCEELDLTPVPQLPTAQEPTAQQADPSTRDMLAFAAVMSLQAIYATTQLHPGHLPMALMGLSIPVGATLAMSRLLHPSPRRHLMALIAGPTAGLALGHALEATAPLAGVVVGIATLVLDRPAER